MLQTSNSAGIILRLGSILSYKQWSWSHVKQPVLPPFGLMINQSFAPLWHVIQVSCPWVSWWTHVTNPPCVSRCHPHALRKWCNITFGPLYIWDPGPQYVYFVLWNAIISSHRWLFEDSSVQIIIGTERNLNWINGGRSPPSFGRLSTLLQYLWSIDLAKNSLMPQVCMILSLADNSLLNLQALAIASFRREINTSMQYIGKESLTLPHHNLIDVLNGWDALCVKRWLSLRWVPIIYYDCLALAAHISDCSIELLPLWCSIVTII